MRGGEGTPARGGMGVQLGPGGPDLPGIITDVAVYAAAAATQGYTAAAAAASPSIAIAFAVAVAVAVADPSAHVMYPMKLLHLRFTCGVATDAEIPRICLEVCWAPTKAAALMVLSQ